MTSASGMATCPNCDGNNEITDPRMNPTSAVVTKACPSCDGSGRVAEPRAGWSKCPACGGWGTLGDNEPDEPTVDCVKCHGAGIVPPAEARQAA
ncbi:MAG: hypothetical protein FJ318_04130 [SAR202 cluster bacterium]|nr:hypothetical protein [SAR202 cluster bacterium]